MCGISFDDMIFSVGHFILAICSTIADVPTFLTMFQFLTHAVDDLVTEVDYQTSPNQAARIEFLLV